MPFSDVAQIPFYYTTANIISIITVEITSTARNLIFSNNSYVKKWVKESICVSLYIHLPLLAPAANYLLTIGWGCNRQMNAGDFSSGDNYSAMLEGVTEYFEVRAPPA